MWLQAAPRGFKKQNGMACMVGMAVWHEWEAERQRELFEGHVGSGSGGWH